WTRVWALAQPSPSSTAISLHTRGSCSSARRTWTEWTARPWWGCCTRATEGVWATSHPTRRMHWVGRIRSVGTTWARLALPGASLRWVLWEAGV
ncbi:unnamed protein product, partial [Closterium sp. NIES-53]